MKPGRETGTLTPPGFRPGGGATDAPAEPETVRAVLAADTKKGTRRMNRTHLLAVLLLAFASPAGTAGEEATERLAIVQAVQNLFDAMATGDGALAAATLIPEGRLIVVTDGTEGITHRAWDHADFVTMIAKGDSVLVERMWDPVVSIDGPIATFRARYDFYRDGDYSHCGVDLFTLVKAAAGWRISGGTFTREVRQCEDNPLPAL